MNLNHLTNSELIEHVLKFDNDPVRVRLARFMSEMPGIILDELEHAGMDPERCIFENTYSPGQYITHLEGEIEWRDREIQELQDKLQELEEMTVLEFMDNVRRRLETAQHMNQHLQKEITKAQDERDDMKSKLSMWTKLNSSPKELM